MTSWLASNFPVSTLPTFVPLMVGLVIANYVLWRYVIRHRR